MKTLASTTDLGELLQQFFCDYLINQRRVSAHTIASYRDSFLLLLSFTAQAQHKPLPTRMIADLDANTIIAFLHYLEQERDNCISTRNARLAAVRCFFNFVATQLPAGLPEIQKVLSIPQKRGDHPLIECLERDEITAIVNAPNQTSWSGYRDHNLLLTLYNTGARVSEITRLQRQDVDLQRQYAVHLHGKGRKERIIPLWHQTITALHAWMKRISVEPTTPLFPNRLGVPLNRSGVRQRLDNAVQIATITCPSLLHRKISPHTIRHTTALHLLQSGVALSVIALWLGHEQIGTTHHYMEANLAMKKAALDALPPISLNSQHGSHKLSQGIIAFLENL